MSLATHIKPNRRRGSDTKILQQLRLGSLSQFVGSDDPYGKQPIGELGDHFSIGVDPSAYGIDYPVAPNTNWGVSRHRSVHQLHVAGRQRRPLRVRLG